MVQKVIERILWIKNIDQKYCCSIHYDFNVNKYGDKCRTSLRFWKNKGWINSIVSFGWFQSYFRYWLSRRSLDDERQINRWKGIASRFKGKLVKMIKYFDGKFDNYSISPKIKHVLLHWSYELVENDLL